MPSARAKERSKWHRTLAAKWRDATIPTCEGQLVPTCTKSLYLTPAHSRKRRDIKTEADYHAICWLCTECHSHIERMPHAEMERVVISIITNRTATADYTIGA